MMRVENASTATGAGVVSENFVAARRDKNVKNQIH
jgi:hypothetical protein